MNRQQAKTLASNVTAEQLKVMLIQARISIKDWTKTSKINKGMTKGAAYNIFTAVDIKDDMHIMGKINMIREFGEYLAFQPKKKEKPKKTIIPYHEEPRDLDNL